MKHEPRLTEAQSSALVQRHWQHPDGTTINEDTAGIWACRFHNRCEYDPMKWSIHHGPVRRIRPIKPTAERLHDWIRIVTPLIRRPADATPIRRQTNPN
jgi:hypothetical protein